MRYAAVGCDQDRLLSETAPGQSAAGRGFLISHCAFARRSKGGELTMRLSKHQAEIATQELLSILAQNSKGLRTSELSGTPKFHGARTLNSGQIHRLLRACDEIEHSYEGTGYMVASCWKLK